MHAINCTIHTGTLDDAPFEKGSFDYIHLRDIVEHVTNPLEFLVSCQQLLKPDGKIYLSIPNGLPLFYQLLLANAYLTKNHLD